MEELVSDQPKSGIRHSFPSRVLGLATGAAEFDCPVESGALKDHLDATIKAALAHVVLWLRRDWVPVMTDTLNGLGTVDERTFRYLEQRVTPALCDEFLYCTQLLAQLEVLLLQLTHVSVVSEQSILSLEKLLIHLRNRSGDHIEVSDANHCLAQFLGSADRTHRSSN
jgi:hypothetical protein